MASLRPGGPEHVVASGRLNQGPSCRATNAEAWVGFESLEPRLLLSGSIAVTVDTLVTSDATPELTGTVDDPAAAVEVTVNGATYDALNDGFGEWTLADDTLPALAEGTYNVLALAVNAGEGTAGSDDTANELTIDQTAPVVTVAPLVTADKTPSLSGTVSEPDAAVWVSVDGSAHQAANNGNGTWTLSGSIVATLDYGTYDVTVTATDLAGNEGTDATTDELTVVQQLPISVTIDPLVTSDTRPELTGTVSLGSAIVQVAVQGTTYAATNNGDGTWTLADNTVAALPEGTYSVLVTASDPGSDAEAQDATANELTIDLTSPVVTVNSLETADQTPQLTGTVSEPGAVVWVTVDGETYRATNNGNGTWTLPNNTVDELDYGTYNVAVTAVDAAENSGTDATTDELTIRRDLSVTIDSLVTSDTTPELTGTVSLGSATVEVSVRGTTYAATNNGDGTWTLADGTVAAVPEGTYDVLVTASDPDSDAEAQDTTASELTVDLTSPVVTVDSLETADQTPQLTGTVSEPGAVVWVTVDGETYRATNNGNGTWTLPNGAVDELEYGTYDVAVTAADEAENSGTDATTNELTIRAELSVSVDKLVTNDTTPRLTGTVSDPDADVAVTVGGATYDATNNGDGTWTLPDDTIGPLAEGNYEVLAVAQNTQKGSYASDSVREDLVIDVTPPAVTITALTTDDTTPELNGTVDDDAVTIIVTVNGRDYTAHHNYDAGEPDGTWTLNDNVIWPLPGGTYDVVVTATDAAENEGTDATTDELTINSDVILVTIDELATTDTTPELTGLVGDPAADVQVTVDGKVYAATNNGDGTWTLADNTVDPLAQKVYDVVVEANNSGAGTSGNDDTTDELTVDTTVPVVTVTGLTTTDRTPGLTGTISESDCTINVNVDGKDYEVSNNDDGTWTLSGGAIWTLDNNTIEELAYGTYNVTVTATDAAGNVGTDATTSELIVQPELAVTVDELVTNDSTPELTGTVEDPGAAIRVTVNGTAYTATNNGDGTWTLADGTVAALTDGTYDVQVLATNATYGTADYDDTTNELTVDLTAPIVTISSLATSDTTPALSGTVTEPGAEIVVTLDGNDYQATNNGDGTWTLPDNAIPLFHGAPQELDHGTYDVAVTATDEAGNAGTDATTDELAIRPELAVTVDELVTTDATPELTGTVNDPDAAVTITVGGTAYTATNNGDGTWTLADGTVAALTDGTYDVQALATNATYGTFDYDGTTNELVVDASVPVVTVTPLTTGDKTPALSGTVTEPGATVLVTVNGNEYQATNNGNGTWTLPNNAIPLFHGAPVELDYGTYDVAVTATDEAGNVGTDATTNELTIGPTLTVTIDELTTNDTTPELTGTVSNPAATVEVTVNGATYAATNNGDGTWTLPDGTVASLAPAFPDEEATYDVLVVAVDAGSGAAGQDATVDELTIDLGEPEVTVTRLDTDDTTPALTGTVSEADASVWVTVDGTTYPATNNGNGTWTVADNRISELAHGTYDVAVTATDPAGNVGTDGTLNELTIRVAPQVSVDELRTNDTTPELTGRVDDPAATIVVTVDGNDYNAVNNGDGTWTLADNTVAALNDGTYDVLATATNTQGNNATDTTTDELAIETVAPGVTVESIDDADLDDAGGTVTTSDTTPGFRGTIDDSNPAEAEIVLTVNGTDYNATFTGFELNDGGEWDGWWEVADGDITPLAPGTYDVTVTVTDEAGNITTETLAGALVITAIPTVTVDALITDDQTPALTGTVGSPDAVVVVTVDGAAYTAINNGDGTWRVPDNSVARLAVGTYDVAVTATNPGGVGTDTTTGELVVIDERTATIDPLITSYRSPGLTGTVNDPDAVIEVQVDGRVYEADNNGDGTWTLEDDTILPLATGTYDVTVRASHSDGTSTFDQTNNELIVVAETTTTLVLTLADKGKIKYRDPDGTNVSIQLKGKRGSATLTFVSDSPILKKGDKLKATNGCELISMIINADVVSIKFSGRGGADNGATIGFIGGNAVLKKLDARNFDLINGGINMTNGIIEQISLRSIQETNVTMGGVAKGVKIRVAENTEDANIRLTMADVKSFTTGSMINSSLLVGTLAPEDSNRDGVSDLPDTTDLFDGFEIKSVKITGYKGAPANLYVNANIAASKIGKVALMNTTLRNLDDDSEEHVPFGITTDSLKKLTLNQGGIKYKWPDIWLATPQDLEVRVG